MTDQPDRDFGREFDREERAFRTALAARAEDCEPVDLALPAPRVRRGGWRRLGVVAAALALIGGVITLVVTRGADDSPSASTGSGDAATDRGTLPIAHAGMRWASRYDVAVEVPTSWPYAVPPGRPDCIRTPRDYRGPASPYVAVDTDLMVETQQACAPPPSDAPKAFGPLLFQLWEPYVSFARAGAPGSGADGTWTYQGWTLTRWTISRVQVTLLTGPGEEDLAARIRASARTFAVDQNGCPATSPVQAKGFVRPPASSHWGEIGSVSVCQYDRSYGTARPGLMGSRTLDGSNLLTTIEKAPAGGGPNAPGTCLPLQSAESAIELLGYPGGPSGPVPLYVYYDSCVGNGVFGDRTLLGGSSRRLTSAICRVLFAEPEVAITEASAPVGRICMH